MNSGRDLLKVFALFPSGRSLPRAAAISEAKSLCLGGHVKSLPQHSPYEAPTSCALEFSRSQGSRPKHPPD
ncbi:hypothetical protein R1flu_007973 [Riccia fluitans]|uniref:Uncharacterized protein n=1 Tax=Riccia fluitans TaxID=41844 RepID=A0ABD1YAD6_9MARC